MFTIPSAAESLFMSFSTAFTQPTFQRIVPLAVGAILTTGRRTVTSVLWTMRAVLTGHYSSYHRVFSRAVWSLWPLGKILATAILHFILLDEPVLVPMDDTTAQHRGKNVYGKGCHHDAVRSAHKHVVFLGDGVMPRMSWPCFVIATRTMPRWSVVIMVMPICMARRLNVKNETVAPGPRGVNGPRPKRW